MPALITYRTPVREDWVDYNGHLRDAYYLLIFSYATDALMERIGLDADSRGQSGNSLFTLEAHINYLHEVKLGTEVWVQTQIIGRSQAPAPVPQPAPGGVRRGPGGQRTDAPARGPGGAEIGTVQ